MYVDETFIAQPMYVDETFIANDTRMLFQSLQERIHEYQRKGIGVEVVQIKGTMRLKLKVPGIEETRETSSPAQA